MSWRWIVIALLAAACHSARGPAPGGVSAAHPNIVLISIDTLRADHCSSYGYPRETTPRLTQLAAAGALVEAAYAPIPATAPSHATMMTSLYPATHGVVKNGYVLSADRVTLAERLKAQGYATAAIVSAFPLTSKFGLSQGFDSYDDDFGQRRPGDPERWDGREVPVAFDRGADVTAKLAVGWLRSRPKPQPFFLWVHFFDPHAPYDPPPAFRALVRPPGTPEPKGPRPREIWSYDGEVRFADDGLGQVADALDAQGLRNQTLFVVVGDHGEGLGDHGRMGHGLLLYEEAVRVPLVLRLPPRIKAGVKLPGPIPLVDLAPTLLEIALGPASREGLQGRSLVGALDGRDAPDPRREIFLQRTSYDPSLDHGVLSPAFLKEPGVKGDKFGVRIGEWKYVVAEQEGTREFYDLTSDPGELRNVVERQPDTGQALAAALGRWRASQAGARRQEMSREDREGLKALGYVE